MITGTQKQATDDDDLSYWLMGRGGLRAETRVGTYLEFGELVLGGGIDAAH
jgi:hypothetical protein